MLKSHVLIFIFSQQFKPKFGLHWSMSPRMEESWCETESDGCWN